MKIPRIVSRETLDILAPSDPRALRSRRDLQRVNRVMGTRDIIIRGMQLTRMQRSSDVPLRLMELGAGDGSLMLRIAQKLSASWPAVDVTFLDQHALIGVATSAEFARLGWRVQTLTVDILEWIAAPMPSELPLRWDVIVANLFLHHFDQLQLSTLLSCIASRCNLFIACEPRRASVALIGSHLVGAMGASRVTCKDAVLSVHAGFRDTELSAIWPHERGAWYIQERAARLFSHFFCANRRAIAAARIDG